MYKHKIVLKKDNMYYAYKRVYKIFWKRLNTKKSDVYDGCGEWTTVTIHYGLDTYNEAEAYILEYEKALKLAKLKPVTFYL